MFHWNIQKYIEEKQLFTLHDKVLVALSGGADSVALLRVLLVLGYHCEAAHCNFHLRGEESDRDERFVNELCKGLGVTLHVTHFDTVAYASRHHVSIEMAAREMRYDWFEQLRKERGMAVIAVGDIVIGDYCRIGLGNTVIGPIRIDNGVNISQNVVLIGLDHNYQDITQGIIEQGITTSPIHIGEHTIIGANVIVLPGITIGKHCFIGAGCVVTQNIPDYCVTVGNPARIIKRYNPQSQTWEKI